MRVITMSLACFVALLAAADAFAATNSRHGFCQDDHDLTIESVESSHMLGTWRGVSFEALCDKSCDVEISVSGKAAARFPLNKGQFRLCDDEIFIEVRPETPICGPKFPVNEKSIVMKNTHRELKSTQILITELEARNSKCFRLETVDGPNLVSFERMFRTKSSVIYVQEIDAAVDASSMALIRSPLFIQPSQ